ncbi:hypothetical protein L1987_40142 [Smallanthus sonchifolius]|uniref:Uncharacterized protein n=1 Tax=Smallanthus sonchifolius TaxID=185202 RepID=A0ACB9GTS2_9ASTR|nr:hypothetical protein L1987_40142 [Smallanthus sonchifolius]
MVGFPKRSERSKRSLKSLLVNSSYYSFQQHQFKTMDVILHHHMTCKLKDVHWYRGGTTIEVVTLLLVTTGKDPGIIPCNTHPPEPETIDQMEVGSTQTP